MDRNASCLSRWFPRLRDAGLPVPRTEIVRTTVDLTILLDGQTPKGFTDFVNQLEFAARSISPTGPWFLRTGQGSGKHSWKECCYVTDLDRLTHHVTALVEWSEMVDIMGLPSNVWAVREFLPTRLIATLPRYGDMPLVAEVRAFVRGGQVVCSHNYWPRGAIRDGLGVFHDDRWLPIDNSPEHDAEAERLYALSCTTVEQREEAHALARRVAKVFAEDTGWSVDLLPTDRGWFVTDMALAQGSFHWPGCPMAETFAAR